MLDTAGAPLANYLVRIGVEGGGDTANSNEFGTVNGSEVISGTTNAAGEFHAIFTSGSASGTVGLRAELVHNGVSVSEDRREIILGPSRFLYLPLVHPGILIGGGADAMLKCQIKSALELVLAGSGIEVHIATAADNFNGDNPHNIVNRLANGNGIQIEQSQAARDGYGQRIADAVTSVYKCKI